MSGGLRRVALVGLAYLLLAGVVVVVADRVRALLALPAAFPWLVRLGLVLGLPVALVIAWSYPRIGYHGAVPPRGEDDRA
jgi:hypothetical protein